MATTPDYVRPPSPQALEATLERLREHPRPGLGQMIIVAIERRSIRGREQTAPGRTQRVLRIDEHTAMTGCDRGDRCIDLATLRTCRVRRERQCVRVVAFAC